MTTLEFNTQLTNLESSLKRYASILTPNREDANDLLQETYLRALDNKEMFISSQYKNLRGWTYTIMKNIFINNYRRVKNQKSKLENLSKFNLTTQENYVYDNLFNKFQLSEMNKAIENLDNNQKKPLLMHLSGFKYKEIADELGVNIGTIKSRIFFARNNLKKLISKTN